MPKHCFSVAALALPAVSGAEQLLLPAGSFDAPRGALRGNGPWTLGAERGAAMASELAARGSDIVIDYEHQTLHAAGNGQPAPAAGWVRPADIVWRAGVGLVATAVHWTERAAAAIAAGEYRYLSPVFGYDDTGAVQALHHVALTNSPALDALPEVALAAAARRTLTPMETTLMSDDTTTALRERMARLLGLGADAADADLDQALGRVEQAMGSGDQAAASLPALIEEHTQRIAALSAQVHAAPGAEVVADLQQQIAALTAREQNRRREAALSAALADGRLLADSPLHQHAASLEAGALEALLGSLTPIAALSATQTGGQAPAGAQSRREHADDVLGETFTAALSAEFGDEATWRAYKTAVAAGRVKTHAEERI